MPVSRRDVLERLAAESNADSGRTTSDAALADSLDADVETVLDHLAALEAQSLATRPRSAGVRVTVTGEELLALDADGAVIVTPPREDTSR